ncbi:type II restriction modification system endonuclease [Mycoplasmopsis californica HAZ160_1]|uniref:type II site-specific deoxyribonuclease n=1 Tax=Mycoplasmopsis californica HAZ160_1 TaxID=1397850 RepID=A0AAT9F840_9BACT|nr:hypothetical protein [Mycoplasmopsis californica]BAP01062.1 type II restriction modification system endonuclease [Mycoplasmopsis californica HAZ160_1]BBG40927.1 type II restriction modification system endonuclease [Mycoplasmopsis californica]BBG41521.1 type II restriction modification system endonuclease [Mycoplasmopsis californica]BBG42114.1 type II restriction modification system endonuclease [Mycoplasmopsis californica]BBG42697.1 type II restriction modification system endonuclease [Myco
MFISYDQFAEKLNNRLRSINQEYNKLLISIIQWPQRYTGIYRITNVKTKLIQNLTQSREIRFGDFLEDIISEYLKIKGFRLINKSIKDENGFTLKVDQYFEDDNNVFLVEQKVRDDHDSTKKRGQFENFIKKADAISKLHPDKNIKAIMWFIDDSFLKNKIYYLLKMSEYNQDLKTADLFYGESFFQSLNMDEMWVEFKNHLLRYKEENLDMNIDIPDFDTSEEILKLLVDLPDKLWRKLYYNNDERYINLRKEIFPSGINLNKAKELRDKRSSKKEEQGENECNY